MLNRNKTKEILGYDFDPDRRRRTQEEIEEQPNVVKKSELLVIDNCPVCNIERTIKYRQSKKDKPCTKCFHNLDYVIKAKQNQKKYKSEKCKQKMRENHWSRKGGTSAFKSKSHTDEVKLILSKKKNKQFSRYSKETLEEFKIQASCSLQGINRKDFKGFITPENIKIRQSPEGKAWRYNIMTKANFTCDKCKQRGGKLCAHHLNAFNSHPEQRFDKNNGVCLCYDCHSDFHTQFGRGNNTVEQYLKFKS